MASLQSQSTPATPARGAALYQRDLRNKQPNYWANAAEDTDGASVSTAQNAERFFPARLGSSGMRADCSELINLFIMIFDFKYNKI